MCSAKVAITLAPFEARIGISCQLNARIITDLQLNARRRISRQLLAYGVPNLGRACKYWTRGGISRQLNARIGISRQLNARIGISCQLNARVGISRQLLAKGTA